MDIPQPKEPVAESETDIPLQDTSTKLPRRKRRLGRSLLLLLVAAVLVAGVSGLAVYEWQHEKVIATKKQVTDLQATNSKISSSLKDLQQKYAVADSALSAYKAAASGNQSNLTINVLGSKYVNPFGSGSGIGPTAYVGVDVTITNSSTGSINFAIDNVKLKDSQDEVFTIYNPRYIDASGLPNGYAPISDQSIAPGETIKGSLIFQLPNNSQHSFTLTNSVNTYPVIIK